MNSDIILVRTLSYRPEAERARQVLVAAGICSVVSGDDASGWAPHIGFATGGTALFLNQVDLEQSERLLQEAGMQ